jgi:hypothetical protein
LERRFFEFPAVRFEHNWEANINAVLHSIVVVEYRIKPLIFMGRDVECTVLAAVPCLADRLVVLLLETVF